MRHTATLHIVRATFVILATLIGVSIGSGESLGSGWIGGSAGLLFGLSVVAIDMALRGFSIRGFSTGTAGLLIGLLCAWLVTRIGFFGAGWLEQFELASDVFHLAVYLGFGFIGVMLALRSKREEFSLLIPYVRFRQDSIQDLPTLLDSNVIIDGRVPAICASGFLGGALVVPRFVLDELQTLADSSDDRKRARGRRGLDSLNRMRSNPHLQIEIQDSDVPSEHTVDGKLTALADELGARIVTNDANLAKVARLQRVTVLNLNELANALKPEFAPGDEFDLELVKEGKDDHQAVGYLSDGTMIVVNHARGHIGSTRRITVSGAMQTNAGRLIFAELKGESREAAASR